jgi:hypothetical protein
MSKLDQMRALGAPGAARQLIPGERVDAKARDRVKAVEARVGLPAGGRRTLVVGDTDGKEPSPIDYSGCPVCAARRAADAARLKRHRASRAKKA